MKIVIIFVTFSLIGLMPAMSANAQEQELEELALDIEKLAQFKTILSDLKKGYEILSGGYNTIKNISAGNFNLHKAFLDGLMAVSPAVSRYKKIVVIAENQSRLITEYKAALKRFKNCGSFELGEIVYMENVYNNLISKSVRMLEELLSVITAGKLRMSDDERLKAIDDIDNEMKSALMFLRHFNNATVVLSLQRQKELNDIHASQSVQGAR